MKEWQFLASMAIAAVAVTTFLWKVWREVRDVQDAQAWLNKDLAEAKKDIEWLVYHFKKGGDST